MLTANTIPEVQSQINEWKRNGKTIGFVPTMGALHLGHLSLLEKAQAHCDKVVVSIYVNPTQFNNTDDLKNYPRILEQDKEKLEQTNCDLLFCPSDEIMYGQQAYTSMSFGSLENVMEGKFRPGHFSGVGLVVSKLFNIVNPDKAFFGEKDFQQLAVIKALTKDLLFPIEIIGVPIKRETDGLAMSSRNVRLTTEQREKAIIFYHSLLKAKDKVALSQPFSQVLNEIQQDFDQLDSSITLEYLELVDQDSLENISTTETSASPESGNTKPANAVLCIAGYVGEIRLIDNMRIE